MKAYALRSYGSPDQLELTELDMPVPAAGEVTPVVGRHYSFREIPEAGAYAEQGHATGKIAVTV
jgi:NADPH:quinone reductase-like Zn-dependent oxidoreductase